MSLNFLRAAPLSSAFSTFLRQTSRFSPSHNRNMYAESATQSSVKSAGPLHFSVFIASTTSSELPIAHPSGASISVTSASIFLPAFLPILTISFARARLSSSDFMKAPLPHLTSRTMQSSGRASFLLIMLDAISGILSTVAVTSRSAYNFLSAGASAALCPTTAIPYFSTISFNFSGEISVLKPWIDSNLSIVPPV